MASRRENILARFLELAQGVQGIAEARRNVLDVSRLQRPAIVIQDGSEQLVVRPQSERRTRVQILEGSPAIRIYVGAAPADQGSLLNTYLARYQKAIFEDATLLALVGGDNGELRYEGASFEEPEAESREARMEVNIVFQYPFMVSDL